MGKNFRVSDTNTKLSIGYADLIWLREIEEDEAVVAVAKVVDRVMAAGREAMRRSLRKTKRSKTSTIRFWNFQKTKERNFGPH